MSVEKKDIDDEDTISVPLPAGTEILPNRDVAQTSSEDVQGLTDVRAAMERLGRALEVVSNEYLVLSRIVFGDEKGVVHACPQDSSGVTPCCRRSPIDLPLTERISLDGAEVTCVGFYG